MTRDPFIEVYVLFVLFVLFDCAGFLKGSDPFSHTESMSVTLLASFASIVEK